MTWKEYIEGRRWYRGTLANENPTKRRKKTTHWTTDKPYAENAAHIHIIKTKFIPELGHTAKVAIGEKPGQLLTAKISPNKVFIGNEPALARKLGLTTEYERLRYDKGNNLAAEILVITEARRRGYDTQAIGRDQLQILDPKVIKVLKTHRVKPRIGRLGYASRSGTTLSRSHHKGFKKVRFA